MNKMKTTRFKKCIKENYIIIFFSFIYFFMLSTFINSESFIDESDNFLGALMVANGRDIYSHYISQHMPFAYYIFSIPAKLFAVNTIPMFRISFYIIMIILWIAMYFRYKDKFGRELVLIYPILYIFSMAFYDITGCSAISDQFQAQGLAILFLEFLYFLKSREITWKTSIFISLAVVLSFGTAFVSSLAIFVIIVAVIYTEIKNLMQEKISIGKWYKYFVKKYWHVILITLVPFIILFIWYLFTDNLYNFYYGAYKLNRSIYHKYTGFGSNICRDILSTVAWYNSMLKNNFVSVFNNGLISLKFIFFTAINIAFFIVFFKRKKEIVIFIIAFTLMCGIRGFEGFHSMAYYSITFIMACMLLKEFFLNNTKFRKASYYIFISLIVASISTQFLDRMPKNVLSFNSAFKNSEYTMKKGSTEYIINKLIAEDEPMAVSTLDFAMHIRAKRLPIYQISTSVPWTWEAFKQKDFSYLTKYKPKVLWHNDAHEVWGYKLKDYAPEFIDYVNRNYVLLSQDYPGLYVKREFLPEALDILKSI